MKEYLNGWTLTALGLLALLLFKNIRKLLREVYGKVDKVEFGGFLFFGLLCGMLWRDGHREHEWRFFTDTMYVIVSVVAITGLGLTIAFRYLKELRGIEQKEEKDAKSTEETSEVPK
jgi:uncharacterized protein YacL